MLTISDLTERKGRGKRRHGLESPRSWDQILFASLYIFTVISQFVLLLCFQRGWEMLSLIIIHCVLTTIVIALWWRVSTIDPECLVTDCPIPCSLNLFGQSVERTNLFCIQCNKKVYGMDHHCTFLNTCIGVKNYCAFIWLLVIAAIHLSVDSIIAVAMESSETRVVVSHGPASWKMAVYVGIYASVSGLLDLFVLALLSLHIFLNFVAKRGTFNWVLYKRDSRVTSGQVDWLTRPDDSPSIMGEISNSFSSRLFRSNRQRLYGASQLSLQRRSTPVEENEDTVVTLVANEMAGTGSNDEEQGSPSPSEPISGEAKPKVRLQRSELLRLKASKSQSSKSTVHPLVEDPMIDQVIVPEGESTMTKSLPMSLSIHTFDPHRAETIQA